MAYAQVLPRTTSLEAGSIKTGKVSKAPLILFKYVQRFSFGLSPPGLAPQHSLFPPSTPCLLEVSSYFFFIPSGLNRDYAFPPSL